MFQSIDLFLKFLLQSMSHLCQECQKIVVADFVTEIKRVENYPDFEAHVIQHSLQAFIPSLATTCPHA